MKRFPEKESGGWWSTLKLFHIKDYHPCFYHYPTPLICKYLNMNNLTRVWLKLNLPPVPYTYPLTR